LLFKKLMALRKKTFFGTDASEIKRPISEEKKTTWHGWTRKDRRTDDR
jgi:hypothetical protein